MDDTRTGVSVQEIV